MKTMVKYHNSIQVVQCFLNDIKRVLCIQNSNNAIISQISTHLLIFLGFICIILYYTYCCIIFHHVSFTIIGFKIPLYNNNYSFFYIISYFVHNNFWFIVCTFHKYIIQNIIGKCNGH